MDNMFICPNCSRPHTFEDFRASRFCQNCGKFLTGFSLVKSSSVRERINSEWPLFPYQPYPQQLQFLKDVKTVVGNRGILAAEACNGFGKTVCALSSILSLGKKIVYATRTHEQVRQVLLEVERINRVSRSKFKAVNLASRQHLCLNEKCRSLRAIEALEACRLLREAGECQYKMEIGSLTRLPPVLSTMRLRKEGKRRKICPYFLARTVAEDCSVIVAPYQYVFNEQIRARVKLELSERILIFDEAHNADQIGQEVLSDTLSERALNNAKKELDAIDRSSEFVDELIAFLVRQIAKKAETETSSDLYENLKKVLNVEDLASFVDSQSDAVDQIRQFKLDQGTYPVCFLNGVLNFLSLVESSPHNSYVAVFRRTPLIFNLVEYRCLDPSLAIKPVVKEAYGTLIMSGTLSPIKLFTEILGLEGAQTRTYSAIADPENVRAIIDPHVSTRFVDRNENMIRRIGGRLTKLIAKIPNGVLIFFPQRRLMLTSLNVWRGMGVMKATADSITLEGKFVFVEGTRAIENRTIVEEYKRAAKSKNGAVLCGVFRGRNAEGSNFPYEEARGIFLVGVPYANYSDPVVKAQIGYYSKKRHGLGGKWYLMDAFRAANQALGRGIRHRDDWCNFILMDSRYQLHQSLISSWVLANGVQNLPQ